MKMEDIKVGDIVEISAQGFSLRCEIKVVNLYFEGYDLEYDILNPIPGNGSYGHWKQRVDGGTIRRVS